MLQKLVNANRNEWDVLLHTDLFAYYRKYTILTGHIFFQLVCGLTPLMPTEYIILTYWLTKISNFTTKRPSSPHLRPKAFRRDLTGSRHPT